MHFYLTFGFLGFTVVTKQTMNLFKGSEDSYADNLYCVRLVIVSLAANIGKLQFLVSKDNFFC